MARTDEAAVKLILPATVKDTIETDVFTAVINTANLIVTDLLGSSSLSDDLLAEIEKYLAAHFLHMGPLRQTYKIAVEETNETYGKLDLDLKATTYGQMASMLDTTGELNSMGKRKISIQAVPQFEE